MWLQLDCLRLLLAVSLNSCINGRREAADLPGPTLRRALGFPTTLTPRIEANDFLFLRGGAASGGGIGHSAGWGQLRSHCWWFGHCRRTGALPSAWCSMPTGSPTSDVETISVRSGIWIVPLVRTL
jgi:hypothetical protein